MKKIFILLAIILILPPVLARQSYEINNNQIRIDLTRYDPSPILIGGEADIIFEVYNTGSSTLRNFEVTAVGKHPFEILNKATHKIVELQSDGSYEIIYKIKVKPNVEEDTYQIALQYYSDVNDRVESVPFDIPVKRIKRTVASTTVTTDPEYIAPGETAFINVEIENNADFAMKDVEVKINFLDAVPLAPYRTTAQKQIEIIQSKSSGVAQFQVIALPDAAPNVYMLPLNIIFDDELGNENIRQDYIGIIISKKPEYDLTVEDSTLIRGTKAEITLSLSNIGPSNIKYLILEILPSKYYKVLNPPRTYIGNLEPDDYETSEFDFLPRRSGNIPIQVKLEYKDDMNNPITKIVEVETYVYSRTYAKMLGILPGGSLVKLIMYIIIISFIYLTYKTWRKTRNLTSSMKSSGLRILVVIANIIRHIKWKYIKRIPRKVKIFFIKLK